ncbi:hypothetical protein HDU91_005176, partial [Kappamyces sp. JEL0680]
EELREIKTKIKEKEELEKETKVKEREAEAKLNKALEKYEQLVAKWENDPSEGNQKVMDKAQYFVEVARENLKRISEELKGMQAMWQTLMEEKKEQNRLVTLKRQSDDASSSVSKRSSNSSRPGQKAFVKRLEERDGNVCVIRKTSTKDGAHIIPYAFATRHGLAEWKRDYQQYCRVPEHGVDDVRNGMLLSPELHRQFENYLFTVEFKDEVYTVKAGNHPDVQWLEGKVLEFQDNDTRPSPGFLARHNLMFELKNLRAAAEPRLDRQHTDSTAIDNYIPSSDYSDKMQYIEEWRKRVKSDTDCVDP